MCNNVKATAHFSSSCFVQDFVEREVAKRRQGQGVGAIPSGQDFYDRAHNVARVTETGNGASAWKCQTEFENDRNDLVPPEISNSDVQQYDERGSDCLQDEFFRPASSQEPPPELPKEDESWATDFYWAWAFNKDEHEAGVEREKEYIKLWVDTIIHSPMPDDVFGEQTASLTGRKDRKEEGDPVDITLIEESLRKKRRKKKERDRCKAKKKGGQMMGGDFSNPLWQKNIFDETEENGVEGELKKRSSSETDSSGTLEHIEDCSNNTYKFTKQKIMSNQSENGGKTLKPLSPAFGDNIDIFVSDDTEMSTSTSSIDSSATGSLLAPSSEDCLMPAETLSTNYESITAEDNMLKKTTDGNIIFQQNADMKAEVITSSIPSRHVRASAHGGQAQNRSFPQNKKISEKLPMALSNIKRSISSSVDNIKHYCLESEIDRLTRDARESEKSSSVDNLSAWMSPKKVKEDKDGLHISISNLSDLMTDSKKNSHQRYRRGHPRSTRYHSNPETAGNIGVDIPIQKDLNLTVTREYSTSGEDIDVRIPNLSISVSDDDFLRTCLLSQDNYWRYFDMSKFDSSVDNLNDLSDNERSYFRYFDDKDCLSNYTKESSSVDAICKGEGNSMADLEINEIHIGHKSMNDTGTKISFRYGDCITNASEYDTSDQQDGNEVIDNFSTEITTQLKLFSEEESQRIDIREGTDVDNCSRIMNDETDIYDGTNVDPLSWHTGTEGIRAVIHDGAEVNSIQSEDSKIVRRTGTSVDNSSGMFLNCNTEIDPLCIINMDTPDFIGKESQSREPIKLDNKLISENYKRFGSFHNYASGHDGTDVDILHIPARALEDKRNVDLLVDNIEIGFAEGTNVDLMFFDASDFVKNDETDVEYPSKRAPRMVARKGTNIDHLISEISDVLVNMETKDNLEQFGNDTQIEHGSTDIDLACVKNPDKLVIAEESTITVKNETVRNGIKNEIMQEGTDIDTLQRQANEHKVLFPFPCNALNVNVNESLSLQSTEAQHKKILPHGISEENPPWTVDGTATESRGNAINSFEIPNSLLGTDKQNDCFSKLNSTQKTKTSDWKEIKPCSSGNNIKTPTEVAFEPWNTESNDLFARTEKEKEKYDESGFINRPCEDKYFEEGHESRHEAILSVDEKYLTNYGGLVPDSLSPESDNHPGERVPANVGILQTDDDIRTKCKDKDFDSQQKDPANIELQRFLRLKEQMNSDQNKNGAYEQGIHENVSPALSNSVTLTDERPNIGSSNFNLDARKKSNGLPGNKFNDHHKRKSVIRNPNRIPSKYDWITFDSKCYLQCHEKNEPLHFLSVSSGCDMQIDSKSGVIKRQSTCLPSQFKVSHIFTPQQGFYVQFLFYKQPHIPMIELKDVINRHAKMDTTEPVFTHGKAILAKKTIGFNPSCDMLVRELSPVPSEGRQLHILFDKESWVELEVPPMMKSQKDEVGSMPIMQHQSSFQEDHTLFHLLECHSGSIESTQHGMIAQRAHSLKRIDPRQNEELVQDCDNGEVPHEIGTLDFKVNSETLYKVRQNDSPNLDQMEDNDGGDKSNLCNACHVDLGTNLAFTHAQYNLADSCVQSSLNDDRQSGEHLSVSNFNNSDTQGELLGTETTTNNNDMIIMLKSQTSHHGQTSERLEFLHSNNYSYRADNSYVQKENEEKTCFEQRKDAEWDNVVHSRKNNEADGIDVDSTPQGAFICVDGTMGDEPCPKGDGKITHLSDEYEQIDVILLPKARVNVENQNRHGNIDSSSDIFSTEIYSDEKELLSPKRNPEVGKASKNVFGNSEIKHFSDYAEVREKNVQVNPGSDDDRNESELCTENENALAVENWLRTLNDDFLQIPEVDTRDEKPLADIDKEEFRLYDDMTNSSNSIYTVDQGSSIDQDENDNIRDAIVIYENNKIKNVTDTLHLLNTTPSYTKEYNKVEGCKTHKYFSAGHWDKKQGPGILEQAETEMFGENLKSILENKNQDHGLDHQITALSNLSSHSLEQLPEVKAEAKANAIHAQHAGSDEHLINESNNTSERLSIQSIHDSKYLEEGLETMPRCHTQTLENDIEKGHCHDDLTLRAASPEALEDEIFRQMYSNSEVKEPPKTNAFAKLSFVKSFSSDSEIDFGIEPSAITNDEAVLILNWFEHLSDEDSDIDNNETDQTKLCDYNNEMVAVNIIGGQEEIHNSKSDSFSFGSSFETVINADANKNIKSSFREKYKVKESPDTILPSECLFDQEHGRDAEKENSTCFNLSHCVSKDRLSNDDTIIENVDLIQRVAETSNTQRDKSIGLNTDFSIEVGPSFIKPMEVNGSNAIDKILPSPHHSFRPDGPYSEELSGTLDPMENANSLFIIDSSNEDSSVIQEKNEANSFHETLVKFGSSDVHASLPSNTSWCNESSTTRSYIKREKEIYQNIDVIDTQREQGHAILAGGSSSDLKKESHGNIYTGNGDLSISKKHEGNEETTIGGAKGINQQTTEGQITGVEPTAKLASVQSMMASLSSGINVDIVGSLVERLASELHTRTTCTSDIMTKLSKISQRREKERKNKSLLSTDQGHELATHELVTKTNLDVSNRSSSDQTQNSVIECTLLHPREKLEEEINEILDEIMGLLSPLPSQRNLKSENKSTSMIKRSTNESVITGTNKIDENNRSTQQVIDPEEHYQGEVGASQGSVATCLESVVKIPWNVTENVSTKQRQDSWVDPQFLQYFQRDSKCEENRWEMETDDAQSGLKMSGRYFQGKQEKGRQDVSKGQEWEQINKEEKNQEEEEAGGTEGVDEDGPGIAKSEEHSIEQKQMIREKYENKGTYNKTDNELQQEHLQHQAVQMLKRQFNEMDQASKADQFTSSLADKEESMPRISVSSLESSNRKTAPGLSQTQYCHGTFHYTCTTQQINEDQEPYECCQKKVWHKSSERDMVAGGIRPESVGKEKGLNHPLKDSKTGPSTLKQLSNDVLTSLSSNVSHHPPDLDCQKIKKEYLEMDVVNGCEPSCVAESQYMIPTKADMSIISKEYDTTDITHGGDKKQGLHNEKSIKSLSKIINSQGMQEKNRNLNEVIRCEERSQNRRIPSLYERSMSAELSRATTDDLFKWQISGDKEESVLHELPSEVDVNESGLYDIMDPTFTNTVVNKEGARDDGNETSLYKKQFKTISQEILQLNESHRYDLSMEVNSQNTNIISKQDMRSGQLDWPSALMIGDFIHPDTEINLYGTDAPRNELSDQEVHGQDLNQRITLTRSKKRRLQRARAKALMRARKGPEEDMAACGVFPVEEMTCETCRDDPPGQHVLTSILTSTSGQDIFSTINAKDLSVPPTKEDRDPQPIRSEPGLYIDIEGQHSCGEEKRSLSSSLPRLSIKSFCVSEMSKEAAVQNSDGEVNSVSDTNNQTNENNSSNLQTVLVADESDEGVATLRNEPNSDVGDGYLTIPGERKRRSRSKSPGISQSRSKSRSRSRSKSPSFYPPSLRKLTGQSPKRKPKKNIVVVHNPISF